ncbi:hypothetical protein BDW66DRAFT_23674 [Aspergillus desertorum]
MPSIRRKEWCTNPLYFPHLNSYFCRIFWRYYNQLLLLMHCPIFTRPVTPRSYNRVQSHDFLDVDCLAEVIWSQWSSYSAVCLNAHGISIFPLPPCDSSGALRPLIQRSFQSLVAYTCGYATELSCHVTSSGMERVTMTMQRNWRMGRSHG